MPRSAHAIDAKRKGDSSETTAKVDLLQKYLHEIGKYPLLTRNEERAYGIRVREQGDTEAGYALVTSNLRLVVKIALEFQRVWMQNLLDLIQEGNIGLMQAVKNFDPYKNVKFSYYAAFWIKAYILKFIMDNWRLVKIGTTQPQRRLFFNLKREKEHLAGRGFSPEPRLLSDRLGVSENDIVEMEQRLNGSDISLDAPVKEDSETKLVDLIDTGAVTIQDQVAAKEMNIVLNDKIKKFRKLMSQRETEIFDFRIYSDEPQRLTELGKRYGISRERVRQIEKKIILNLQEFLKQELPELESYANAKGLR